MDWTSQPIRRGLATLALAVGLLAGRRRRGRLGSEPGSIGVVGAEHHRPRRHDRAVGHRHAVERRRPREGRLPEHGRGSERFGRLVRRLGRD